MATEINTGVGRIVWGHPLKSQIKKDQRTKQPVLREGKQVEQWVFGVAFPKNEFGAVWQQFANEAATLFPNGVPGNFSWKVKDGDGVDSNGKPYSLREGWAGCYVVTISTEAFAPQVYKSENGAYRQLEAQEIKTGDFVALKLLVKANQPQDRTNTPGLYVNPQGVLLVGYGQEIRNTANPDEMFGGQQYALPAGATATPQAPMGGAMPPFGSAPMATPMQQPGYAPQPQAAPMAMPMAAAPGAAPYAASPAPMVPMAATAYPSSAPMAQPMPAPAHDFVQNAGMPQQQYAMPGQQPMAAPGAYPPGIPQR